MLIKLTDEDGSEFYLNDDCIFRVYALIDGSQIETTMRDYATQFIHKAPSRLSLHVKETPEDILRLRYGLQWADRVNQ